MAKADLDVSGFPGTPSTRTNETGTIHSGIPGSETTMNVRVMDGKAVMQYSRFILILFLVVYFLSCCRSSVKVETNIILDGFSEENYHFLNGALGTQTCVTGNLSVGTDGIYFLLHSGEADNNFYCISSQS